MGSGRHLARNAFDDEGVFVIKMQNYTEDIQDIWVLNGNRLEINQNGTRSDVWAISEDGLRIEILNNPRADDQWGVGNKHIEVRQ